MQGVELSQAVERLAQALIPLSESTLEQDWTGTPGEGLAAAYRDNIREIAYYVYVELRDLANRITTERATTGPAMTIAQRAESLHQIAYRDVRGILLGVNDDEGGKLPAVGQWPLHTVIIHMMITEYWGFFPQIQYGLTLQKRGEPLASLPDQAVLEQYGPQPDANAPHTLSGLMADFDTRHAAMRDFCAALSDAEVATPTLWWEEQPVPIRFRLHRFDAHLREHTIQIEKTLRGIGHVAGEAEQLVRLLYNALGEVEGALLGVSANADAYVAARQVAASIDTDTAEIMQSVL